MSVAKKASAGMKPSGQYNVQYGKYLTRSELKELEEKEKYINTLWDLGMYDVPESLPLNTLKKMITNLVEENKFQQGVAESEYVVLKPRPKMRAS